MAKDRIAANGAPVGVRLDSCAKFVERTGKASDTSADLVKRVDQLQALVRQRKTTAKSSAKTGKQLFMDEYDQLTTGAAGHTDLAEIGNVGQSELLSTSELLGGRTLRI